MNNYKGIYDAIFDYLKNIINDYDDEYMSKEVNIEIMNIDDDTGILIQKIASNPLLKQDITGLKVLMFKFSLKSIQNYIPSDNKSKLDIVQSLDRLGDYIAEMFYKGNTPMLPIKCRSNDMEILNSASVIETSENKITANIDMSFTYKTYY